MLFKERLRELMTEKEVNQVQLAKEIDFSQRSISMWLLGQAEPRETALRRLSQFFGCSVDYLLGRSDDFGNITVTPSPSSDLSASSPNASLTPEERELLELYKKLPGTRKKTVLDTIRFMSDSSETSDKTRKEKYYGSK